MPSLSLLSGLEDTWQIRKDQSNGHDAKENTGIRGFDTRVTI